MLLRDRPVLEHIVEQHAEEAAFLWTQRDAATDAPHYKRHHLARLDERVEAHVDGLRVAGDAGWRIAMEQLERRCEAGEMFAAGILALESGDMRRIEPLVVVAEKAEPDVRRGFVGAIAWCRPGLLVNTVHSWDGSVVAFERCLALCACSVHRAEPGAGLVRHLRDADAMVRARAIRLVGELGRRAFLPECLDESGADDPDVAFWGAWSAVLLGDREEALEVLKKATDDNAPRPWSALELACRASQIEDVVQWLRTLPNRPQRDRTIVAALGHVGDPVFLPWLLAKMHDPALARIAAASLSLMTGVDFSLERLEQVALESGNPVTSELESIVADPDEHLPLPNPALVDTWLEQNSRRFKKGHRYLLGRPVGPSACEQAWTSGTQIQRRSAATELSLLTGVRLRSWCAVMATGRA
jgi:uncharacterized protein (TIGR02270 family)